MNTKETRATISKIFNYIENGVEKTSFGDFMVIQDYISFILKKNLLLCWINV